MRYFGLGHGHVPVEYKDGKWVSMTGHEFTSEAVESKMYAPSLIHYLEQLNKAS
jgi:hypothetical protein